MSDKSTIERKLDLLFEALLHVAKATLDEEEFEEMEGDLRGVNSDYSWREDEEGNVIPKAEGVQ